MAELTSAIQDPHALITLAVLILAVVLFISGALAPELTGLLSVGLLWLYSGWLCSRCGEGERPCLTTPPVLLPPPPYFLCFPSPVGSS